MTQQILDADSALIQEHKTLLENCDELSDCHHFVAISYACTFTAIMRQSHWNDGPFAILMLCNEFGLFS